MNKIKVIFWSQTGNTQMMADAIAKGIQNAGKEAKILTVDSASVDELRDANVIVLGCPAMGAEVLEESEMEPFVEELEAVISGKTVALFGSYGWGDGEWMRDWVDRMRAAGATILNGEGLICHETPDDDTLSECENFGMQIATI